MILGCDISTWQDSPSIAGGIDFEKMKSAGAEFVIIKASQGLTVDPDYRRNVDGARAAGLLVGSYHLFNTSPTGDRQADFYYSIIGRDALDLPPVADFEWYHVTLKPSQAAAKSMLKTFCERIQTLTHRVPMIYTNGDQWRRFGGTEPAWALYPLWQAQYSATAPTPPAPFSRWAFWQYSDKGDGLALGVESKELDMNWYNGTLADLRQFCGLESRYTDAEKLARLWKLHPEAW